jgi:hypothetical protein
MLQGKHQRLFAGNIHRAQSSPKEDAQRWVATVFGPFGVTLWKILRVV